MNVNNELALRRAEAKALAAELRAIKAKADLDYVAMMTEVDIPTDDESQPEEENK